MRKLKQRKFKWLVQVHVTCKPVLLTTSWYISGHLIEWTKMSFNWVNVKRGYDHWCNCKRDKWTFSSVFGSRMLPNSCHATVYQITSTPTVGNIMQMRVLITVDYSFTWVQADQIEMKPYFMRQHIKECKLNCWWTHATLEFPKFYEPFHFCI